MAHIRKHNFRQGIIGYGSDKIKYRTEGDYIYANTDVIITIASGRFNYHFTIQKNTKLCKISSTSGNVIAFIDPVNNTLSYQYIKKSLSNIYVNSKPQSSITGDVIYDVSVPRGYTWNGSSWCPLDFVCILNFQNNLIVPASLGTQLGSVSGDKNTYSLVRSYTPKKNSTGNFIYTLEQSQVFIIEDNEQEYDDLIGLYFPNYLIASQDIPKFSPIYINEYGMVSICTSTDSYQCIGVTDADVQASGTITNIIKSGIISNQDWLFTPEEFVFVDVNGSFVQDIDIDTTNYIKLIGVCKSPTEILLQISNTIIIENES